MSASQTLARCVQLDPTWYNNYQPCCELRPAGMLYLATKSDMALLSEGPLHQLVHFEGFGPHLEARLAAVAAGGALNLAPLSAAALADIFLPPMLPDHWRCPPPPTPALSFGESPLYLFHLPLVHTHTLSCAHTNVCSATYHGGLHAGQRICATVLSVT